MAVKHQSPRAKQKSAPSQQAAKQPQTRHAVAATLLPRPCAVLQRAQDDPCSLTASEVDVLQRTVGQRNAQRMLAAREVLQTKPTSATESFEAGKDFETRLHATQGGGRPLPGTTREFMGSRLGADFSAVRLHTGGESEQLNRSINAQAFTRGHDIYLGEGETNLTSSAGKQLLAHELTHTIQQGAVPLQRQPARPQVEQSAPPTGAVQRSFKYMHEGKIVDGMDISSEVVAMALLKRTEKIKQLLTDDKPVFKDKSQTPLPTIDEVLSLDIEKLRYHIRMMMVSPTQEGEFDFDNDQQLALFVQRLRQRVADRNQPYLTDSDNRSEKTGVDEQWKEYADAVITDTSAEPSQVCKLAILGAGASAAYYLVNAASDIDFAKTLVIGNKQPWAGERGWKGVINHPMNMIAPNYQGTEVDEGLAPREEFSKLVASVLARVPEENLIEKTVITVSKAAAKDKTNVRYYRIETNKGFYYAQKVVVGMGIGKHKLPEDFKSDKDSRFESKVEVPDVGNYPRIMNMDQFQRLADRFDANEKGKELSSVIKSMIIMGPNAAIDVATTALRHKIPTVYWVVKVGGDPAFLEGTDNIFVKDIYEKKVNETQKQDKDNPEEHFRGVNGAFTFIQQDYLESAIEDDGVRVKYGKRGDNRGSTSIPQVIRGSVRAQIAVYGLGPDTTTFPNMFGKEFSRKLEPTYDINQHFNDTPEDYRGRLVEYLATRPPQSQSDKPAQAAEERVKRVESILGDGMVLPQRVKDDKDFFKDRQLVSMLPSVVGFQSIQDDKDDTTSLEFIGASAARVPASVKYAYVSKAFTNTKEELTSASTKYKSGLEKLGLDLKGLESLIEAGIQYSKVLEAKPVDKAKESRYDDAIELSNFILKVLAYQGKINKARDLFLKESPVDWATYHVLLVAYGLARQTENGFRMLREYLEMKITKGESGVDFMAKGVINALPQNVVLPDQLTPTRSMIESSQDAMPMNLSKGINLVTSDRTVIAGYIAVNFGQVPPPLADYVSAKIVYDRRNINELDKQPLPKPKNGSDPFSKFDVEKQKAFGGKWKITLEKLDHHFVDTK